MSGLETAIRNALERSDRTSAETRARIYQSARQALETGLQKQGIEDQNVVAQQRHRLEAVIHAIETEERAALKARPASAPSVSLDDAVAPRAATTRPEPQPSGPDRREPAFAGQAPRDGQKDGGLGGLRADRDGPVVSTAAAGEVAARQSSDGRGAVAPEVRAMDGRTRRRKRGRLLSLTMVVATLAAALVAAVWWVETNNLLQSPAARDTNVANPPATVASQDFDGAAGLQTLGAQEGFTGDWVEVYTPGKTGAITPGPQATAELAKDDGGQRMLLTSADADADGDVTIEIPAAILAELSGKTSTLALTVQATPGKATEFAVECNFSSLGECGRHRFTLHDERVDMLFKVTFDRSLAPSAAGQLVINSDISGGGKGLNLYAIRVLPGQ
ncbi:biotin transporter BioY [Ensifer sp. LC163]|uniref:biotin transporter BioY n=1 Tax=Ensifer sp. LC163 TaxID=1120652 RepID=UPI0008138474|nr:biotin transporter BioY [Ensifer sp. LC163]OCP37990.1 biotin transporter BioY [Ensifer sp. LC163]